ncbi:hypothetical protein KFE25_004075 [Diacronema lutheri]|uniref:Peroxisomal membrane protein MPV17 n=1 Tax=Diacronema lutheri TaxID=2081491 RepID=A0A8J5XLF2_DIALT|nr:hypothetical protein KFE25_004075 [Diacronema lutheri]
MRLAVSLVFCACALADAVLLRGDAGGAYVAHLQRSFVHRRARVLALLPASAALDGAPPLADVAAACSSLARAYTDELSAQPLLTHVGTAMVLSLAGDACSQLATAPLAYDVRRGASMGAFAALYTGLFQAWWFDQLNHALPGGGSGIESLCAAVVKMSACQFCTIPLLYLPLLFGVQGVVRGLGWERTIAHAKQSFWPLLQRNWAFWVPLQTVQFALVPTEWQLLFVCTAALAWAAALSAAAEPANLSSAEPSAASSMGTPSDLDAWDQEEVDTVMRTPLMRVGVEN